MAVIKSRVDGPSISQASIVAIEVVDVTSEAWDGSDNPARAIRFADDSTITFCPANHSADEDAVTQTFAGGVWHAQTVRKILTSSTTKTGIAVGW